MCAFFKISSGRCDHDGASRRVGMPCQSFRTAILPGLIRRLKTTFVFAMAGCIAAATSYAEDRLFGTAGGPGAMRYYESSVQKFAKDGEVFFGVTGYGQHPGQSAKMDFRVIFNCGNRSKIGVVIEGVMRNEYRIENRVQAVGTPRGVWYSLQSHHCPSNHFDFDPDALWKGR